MNINKKMLADEIGRILGVPLSDEELDRFADRVKWQIKTLCGCDDSYELVMGHFERKYGCSQADIVRIREIFCRHDIGCDCDFVKCSLG